MSPPIVKINPNNFTAKVLGSVKFLCSAIGIGDFSYRWESLNLVHTNERSLIISSVLPQHQGQYKCTALSSYSHLSSTAFAMLHVKGTYVHKTLIMIVLYKLLCFIAPSFDPQTAILHQISSNASTNTITVLIPKADESNGPIRLVTY